MKSDILYTSLRELGLTEIESKLYIEMLHADEPTISGLAQLLGVERLTIYRALETLEQQTLIERQTGKKKPFHVGSPSKVISLLRHKQAQAKNLGDELTDILPDLLSEYHQSRREPKVRLYETKESFMALLDEVVNEAEDNIIYVLGSADILSFVPEYMDIYIQHRSKKKIISKNLSFYNRELMARNHKDEFRQLKWLPKEFDAQATYIAYGHKVAIWNTANPKIIVIDDSVIFKFFKIMFDMLWEKY